MDIAIVRQDGRHHRAVATTDRGTVQFAVADYGGQLPHDLVHFAVERELGLRHGFWGLIAQGARLDAVAAFGARRPRSIAPAADPLVAEHADELIEAERLVNALARPDGADEGDGLDPAISARLHAAVATLRDEWNATPVDGALHLTWV